MNNINTLEHWTNLCAQIITIDRLHFVKLDDVLCEVEDQSFELSAEIVADDLTRLLPYTSTVNNITETGFTYFVPIKIIKKYLI